GGHRRRRQLQSRDEELGHHLERGDVQGFHQEPGRQGPGHYDVHDDSRHKRGRRSLGLYQTVWARRKEKIMSGFSLSYGRYGGSRRTSSASKGSRRPHVLPGLAPREED